MDMKIPSFTAIALIYCPLRLQIEGSSMNSSASFNVKTWPRISCEKHKNAKNSSFIFFDGFRATNKVQGAHTIELHELIITQSRNEKAIDF